MKMERIWCMPNKNTFLIKPIKQMLQEEITEGLWLDPFANNSTIKTLLDKSSTIYLTNDLNPHCEADFHMDALDFFKTFKDNSIDGVLYDPPYSPRQVSECYKNVGHEVTMQTTQASFWSRHKDEIARILKPNGKVICFGWNSMGCGKKRGFEMERLLLVPHGGNHNDTICTVERKITGIELPKTKHFILMPASVEPQAVSNVPLPK